MISRAVPQVNVTTSTAQADHGSSRHNQRPTATNNTVLSDVQ